MNRNQVKRSKRENGMGTFEMLENGLVRYRKPVGKLPNGSIKRLTVTGTSKNDCICKMKTREAEYKSTACLNSEYIYRKTLTELCEDHLNEHLNEEGRLKPKSADRRESTIKNQIKPYTIGNLQVSTVTSMDVSDHIETLLREGGVSVSSVEKAFDVINSAFKWAKSKQFINSNPCDAVLDRVKNRFRNLQKRNSSDGVVVILSDKEIDVLQKYVNSLRDSEQFYRVLTGLSLLLLLYTGIRSGELCALRWSDWNERSKTLRIIKTRNIVKNRNSSTSKGYICNENEVKNYHARTIELSDEATEVLFEMKRVSPNIDPEDYILVNRSGNPSNPSNYYRNINSLYRKAGLSDEITGAHILRRTRATKMYIEERCQVETIAAYLGDTPETIIKHYISLTQTIIADNEVLNVVRLPQKQNRF